MAGAGGWFDEARFGTFIHWGQSSQLGCELSWPMVGGIPALPQSLHVVPVDEYHAGGLTFSPKPGAPGRWIELAAGAGARYAVLTAKLARDLTVSWLIFSEGDRADHNACAAASTSSAWPSTFTLRQIRVIRPFRSIRTVVRRIPRKVLPYIDFSPQAPYDSSTSCCSSEASGTESWYLSRNAS